MPAWVRCFYGESVGLSCTKNPCSEAALRRRVRGGPKWIVRAAVALSISNGGEEPDIPPEPLRTSCYLEVVMRRFLSLVAVCAVAVCAVVASVWIAVSFFLRDGSPAASAAPSPVSHATSPVPAAAGASVAQGSRVLGASLVPWFGAVDGPGGQAAILELKADHGNTLSIVLPLCQASLTSSRIWACPDMPSDASLTSAIQFARSNGLQVMLDMLIDVAGKPLWRGNINPTDRTAWFTQYGAWLVHYGRIAQAAGASGDCIGSEMIDVTDTNVNASNTAMWVRYIIHPLRSVFTGWLTYSALDGTDAFQVGIWPYVNRIGVSANFNLAGNDSVSNLETDWRLINGLYVSLLLAYNKPILFTDIGYRNVAGDHLTPSSYASGKPDQAEQASDYKALLQYWGQFHWWDGVVWWYWSAASNQNSPANTQFTPQGKQAEATMKQYFAQDG